ncbi:hydrophobin 2 [Suillus paluster]|uniref:hydrophobin 2 n=1 Tax=Suillus paluster TaxID=48578 RepID=UPI001B86BBDA|nr:hydrophobin 2 [Suillus paluster]KAG1745031.1 hydrophobin 2 [Suillus paluster]
MIAPSILLTSLLAFVAGTSAVPALSARGGSGDTCSSTGADCNTGSVSCCQSTYSSDSATVGTLTSLLGIVLGPVEGSVGLGCSPISVIGAGSGATCNQEPVCCSGNTYNGLINIGCSPINIYL